MTRREWPPTWGPASFWIALLLALWGLFVNSVTFANSDGRVEHIQAIVCSFGAVLLVVVGWRRMNSGVRLAAVAIVLVACCAVIDARARWHSPLLSTVLVLLAVQGAAP